MMDMVDYGKIIANWNVILVQTVFHFVSEEMLKFKTWKIINSLSTKNQSGLNKTNHLAQMITVEKVVSNTFKESSEQTNENVISAIDVNHAVLIFKIIKQNREQRNMLN